MEARVRELPAALRERIYVLCCARLLDAARARNDPLGLRWATENHDPMYIPERTYIPFEVGGRQFRVELNHKWNVVYITTDDGYVVCMTLVRLQHQVWLMNVRMTADAVADHVEIRGSPVVREHIFHGTPRTYAALRRALRAAIRRVDPALTPDGIVVHTPSGGLGALLRGPRVESAG